MIFIENKEDLHYIVLKGTQKATQYIDTTIASHKGDRTPLGNLIPGFLREYKTLLDKFASAMKNGHIDIAYGQLDTMKKAASELEFKLNVRGFPMRIFEKIEFEFKKVSDLVKESQSMRAPASS